MYVTCNLLCLQNQVSLNAKYCLSLSRSQMTAQKPVQYHILLTPPPTTHSVSSQCFPLGIGEKVTGVILDGLSFVVSVTILPT